MKYILALLMVLGETALAQGPGLPKPSPAVKGAYDRAVVLNLIVQEKQNSLKVSMDDLNQAAKDFQDLAAKECQGCQYDATNNEYRKPIQSPAKSAPAKE